MRGVAHFLLAGCLALAGAAPAQTRYSADELKAAFLYNFGSFVTWPPEARAGDGIVIGVMNADEVETELRRNTATRPGRPISVRRIVNVEELKINGVNDVPGKSIASGFIAKTFIYTGDETGLATAGAGLPPGAVPPGGQPGAKTPGPAGKAQSLKERAEGRGAE